MSAKKAIPMQCLVISHNGDGDQLQSTLTELGLDLITSGTGQEGADAIKHFKPKAVILLYHAGSSKDVVALRAIESSCRQAQSFPVAVIVSAKEQVPVVKRMLGSRSHRPKNVNVLACPPISQPVLALGGKLKPVLYALLNQRQRQPQMTAQAVSA